MTELVTRAIGAPMDRVDGRRKVTGTATYAGEQHLDGTAHAVAVQSTIAAGRVLAIDTGEALAMPGVLLVLTHENAPRLEPLEPRAPMFQDQEAEVLQSDVVAYRGQIVAAVVAETLEAARQAAASVVVRYEEAPHDVELRAGRDGLEVPPHLNAGHPTDTSSGDAETALGAAAVAIDRTYTTPATHHNPMEPHSTVAIWSDQDGVTLYDSNQGPHVTRANLAIVLGLDPERVRVIAPYVGGGFGSKVLMHPHLALAVMAARAAGRPVKLALTRQQMFALVGYRTPTIQRVRLGADAGGRLTAITHDVVSRARWRTGSPSRRRRRPGCCTRRPTARRRTAWPGSTCPTRRSCARPASARACSRWSRRWTSSPSRPVSTRSSCGCATCPTCTPRAGCPSAATGWARACARAPGGSSGPGATPGHGSARRAGGWSAPGWPRPRTRPGACPARRSRGSSRTARAP
jgi:hypothetical protein